MQCEDVQGMALAGGTENLMAARLRAKPQNTV
jgi:hypothetical protein